MPAVKGGYITTPMLNKVNNVVWLKMFLKVNVNYAYSYEHQYK